MEKTRIMLVESSDYFLNTLLINNVYTLEIAGNAKSGIEAMSQYRNIDPDIIFMDMILSDMTGLEAARWIREQTKGVKIVLFSFELRLEFLLAGIEMGINGYLQKNASRDTINNMVNALRQGHFFVQESVDTCTVMKNRLTYYN